MKKIGIKREFEGDLERIRGKRRKKRAGESYFGIFRQKKSPMTGIGGRIG